MQTLTDERSYSEKKSSKTWYKQEYSMAFEHPVSHHAKNNGSHETVSTKQ